MTFNPTAKSKTQIANENKKDSSEEGANEGYSYVSGQANLKPKVHIFLQALTSTYFQEQFPWKEFFFESKKCGDFHTSFLIMAIFYLIN